MKEPAAKITRRPGSLAVPQTDIDLPALECVCVILPDGSRMNIHARSDGLIVAHAWGDKEFVSRTWLITDKGWVDCTENPVEFNQH